MIEEIKEKKILGFSIFEIKFFIALGIIILGGLFNMFALPVPAIMYPTNLFNTWGPLTVLIGFLYVSYLFGSWRAQH